MARPGQSAHTLAIVGDTVLCLHVAFNTIVVGAGIGAYGARMLVALLPHGPVELVAFAAALSLYRRARRGPVTRRAAALRMGACATGLALAAALETFVAL